VQARVHLARLYGGVDPPAVKVEGADPYTMLEAEGQGWREASEVIAFLNKRGAKIPLMRHVQIEGEWAALSSDADGDVMSPG
jgi:hypothetical protein